MNKVFGLIFNWLKRNLPLLAVVAVALMIAFQNIDPKTFYSGWDNVHPEFDLKRYAQQVFFGAWLEHQNLGAPMNLAHLSEISRLPILFALQALLPMNLSRYAFIFLMYLIGGIGMYVYLSKVWLNQKKNLLKNWLASLGGIFYLLHILTLQQFYIAFEVFTVQFALLPFLLLTIHALAKKINAKNLLLFFGLQILIAPSGHTPTVFYLGAIFSVLYAFCLLINKGWSKAVRFGVLVGLLTFFANAYWILPNLYYSSHDVHYVEESHDNILFGPESVQSIKDAGTLSNLLTGKQYLFTWKDYNFEKKEFEYIFNEWQPHLDQLPVKILMTLLGIGTVAGVVTTAADKRKGAKRWAIIGMYVGCVVLIWNGLLPTHLIVDKLYQSKTFLEAFRNAFTKLSVIYSFVSIVMFVQLIEKFILRLKNKFIAKLSLVAVMAAIIIVAWPSFQGHFLSEKLKVEYPTQYWQMFDYLKTRDKNLRILQLPQLSHAGWEYYDWQFLGAGNGYQGMGFYMFGFPQAFANRDSDRWVETSDFFYYELQSALDIQDVAQFKTLLAKYNIDLLIVDETKIDPNEQHDFAQDHQLTLAAGLKKVWQKDFLTIYERESQNATAQVLIPKQVTTVAGDTTRVRTDYLYKNEGDSLLTPSDKASVLYPFDGLTAHQLNDVTMSDNGLQVTQTVPAANYTLTVPGLQGDVYFAPAAIEYQNTSVTVKFPTITLDVGDKILTLPKLADIRFSVAQTAESLLVFFNDVGVIIKRGETTYPVLKLVVGQPISVEYAPKPEQLPYLAGGSIDASQLPTSVALVFTPDWSSLQQPIIFTGNLSKLTITSEFPVIKLDPSVNTSRNCAVPEQGSVHTQATADGVVYQANGFGVNCTGYGFPSLSPAYSYILHLAGANQQGRGMKFFMNYPDQSVVAEDYLMEGKTWDTFLTLDQVSADPTASFEVNWETRSFGKKSVNTLKNMEITPFPLRQLAQLKLERVGTQLTQANPVMVIADKNIFGSVHQVKFDCGQASCFIGLDQSYDDLWLAVKLGDWGILPHVRLNTWANVWQISGNGTIVIFYLPELISFLSMGLLVAALLILLAKSRSSAV